MTTRFLEILKDLENKANQMVVHKNVLAHGPFWASVHSGAVKNRYNDVYISNVKYDDAQEIADLLNALERGN